MSFYKRNERTWSGVVWSLYELGFRSLGQISRLVQDILMDRLAARLRQALERSLVTPRANRAGGRR